MIGILARLADRALDSGTRYNMVDIALPAVQPGLVQKVCTRHIELHFLPSYVYTPGEVHVGTRERSDVIRGEIWKVFSLVD